MLQNLHSFFTSSSVDTTLFPRQKIPQRSKDTQPSRLAQLLAEYNKLSANPYFEYGRFNGEVSSQQITTLFYSPFYFIVWLLLCLLLQNHGFAVANVYRIFLPMSKVYNFVSGHVICYHLFSLS